MAVIDDMNIYNSVYTGKQIDAGLGIIYQDNDGVKTIRKGVFIATDDNGEANPISTKNIVNTSDLNTKLEGYATLSTEQTVTGLKVFVGGLNIQGNNLNIAPNGSFVFNASNNKTITFAMPATLADNITITLPVSNKDMEDIGKGSSGSTTLQLSTTDYTNTDAIWQDSTNDVDTELGKYYFNITLGSGSTIVHVRTTSNYSLSESSITTLGSDQETWPEINSNNRIIINESGTKTVRVYSNAKIAGRTQIAYIQQS